MEVLSAAVVVCLAMLTWRSPTVAPFPLAEVPGNRSRMTNVVVQQGGSQLTEFPGGRGRRPDRYREEYENKVRFLLTPGQETVRSLELAVDSTISLAQKWYNISSDQQPVSLTTSSTTGLWIYVLRGSYSRPSIGRVVLAPGNGELLKLDAASGAQSFRGASSSLANPQRLAVDSDDNVWIADRDRAEVVKLSGVDFSRLLAVGTSEKPAGARPRFCLPIDVAAAISGFVFVADSTVLGDTARRECFSASHDSRLPSRVVRFETDGTYAGHFDLRADSRAVRLSVDARRDLLFVADIDASRLYAYGAGLRPGSGWAFGSLLGEAALSERVIDLRVHPTKDLIYASTTALDAQRFSFGLTLNASNLGAMFVQARWSPPTQAYGFYRLVGLAVDKDGSALYAADDDGATTAFWKYAIA